MGSKLDAEKYEDATVIPVSAHGLIEVIDSPAFEMIRSEAQVEWAQRIRVQINAEFDRVAAALRSVAKKQAASRRKDTETIVAILEDKRAEVMNRNQAGYFIRDWQEIDDQVQQMIRQDSRYQAIKARQSLESQS